jgi:hypothetical protein
MAGNNFANLITKVPGGKKSQKSHKRSSKKGSR